MQKPVLVVMAAGMGSRYGGLKQIDPVGAHGQALMDYSLFDAKRAGFEEAVFVISPQMSETFPEQIKERLGDSLSVRCAVQRLDDLPAGFTVPQGRQKPWGTGHAIRACRELIDGPFAAVNADDYYGPAGFAALYEHLAALPADAKGKYAMVGYELTKTLSPSGSVARGICTTDENGMLVEIHERTHIIDSCDGPLYTEDGSVYHLLARESMASMNLWGFSGDFMRELDERFARFLARALETNPLKGEYFLPEVVSDMLQEGTASARVLPCRQRWYGMTYPNDKPVVVEAIAKMTAEGIYPEKLWK